MSTDYSSLSDKCLKEMIAELQAKLKNRSHDEITYYRRDIALIKAELKSRK